MEYTRQDIAAMISRVSKIRTKKKELDEEIIKRTSEIIEERDKLQVEMKNLMGIIQNHKNGASKYKDEDEVKKPRLLFWNKGKSDLNMSHSS